MASISDLVLLTCIKLTIGLCWQVQIPKPDVVITSFEALVSDAAALKAMSWDIVIVDERTRMHSALSRAYQAVYGIHCRARAIVANSSLLKTVSVCSRHFC